MLDMSGGNQDTRTVERLLPTLSHRGPDDRGVAATGPVVFGHTRLSILGVEKSRARQPLKCGKGLLNFNGEIYNFEELASRLEAEGVGCEGGSDTEVLGLCFDNWGLRRPYEESTRCLHLLGMTKTQKRSHLLVTRWVKNRCTGRIAVIGFGLPRKSRRFWRAVTFLMNRICRG